MICPSCQAENADALTACSRCGASLETPTAVVVTVDLSPGALFHGRYEIEKPLGRGGMGMVYRAHDRTLDERVAIKVLRPDFAQDPKMAERFRSEIKIARRIRHRNVCAIHDYGEDRGLLYISMELIDGVDMKQVLRERGGLPSDEAYDVSIQLAEGLEAVHAAGIIHRDLKTPNIMVDRDHVARLMDFGIAKRQEGGGTATATGQVLGTPEYMAPEQAQGHKVDFRTDVYALGVVIYEIFTGNVPFRGDTPISTILKHLNDPPPLDVAGLPQGLRSVLRRALAKEPDLRYPTARALADGLREARSPSRKQQPMPTVALEAPTLPQPVTRRAIAPWMIALPLLAVAGGGYLALRRGHAVDPTPPPPSTTLPPPPTTTATSSVDSLAMSTRPPEPTTTLPAPSSPPPHKATPAPSPRSTPGPPSPTPTPPPPTTLLQAPAVTAAPQPGMLQIVVRPWAEVSIDGRLVGTTPMDRVPLPAGPHTLSLRHPAYEALARAVAIKPGETTRLVIDLPTEGVKRP